MTSSVQETVALLLPEITALRHRLHTHPEVRFEERWTSDRVAEFLAEAGIPHKRGYAKGTGIVATVEGRPGKTAALRADMDALEIDEQTGLSYASTIPNRMHACGHDGHTAILCGAAKLLWRHRRDLKGSVRLIFQPAEEIAGGGQLMVDEGALDGADAVFALHGWPGLPLGKFGVKSGPMMASANDFKIVVNGKGCHAADPASGADPILAGAHITTALHSIVSREVNPWEAAALTVAKFHGGSATNIIPDSIVLEGTYRSLNHEVNKILRAGIERVAAQTARALRCEALVEFGAASYPPLVNDAAMTDHVRGVIADEFSPEAIHDVASPSMAAEDL
ncbi:MAG: amidohydrolase [Candidatus Hydrogenedentes bacterium]|nr:amidohydrolase [Candidatus Hydrogenedentota bacterium]